MGHPILLPLYGVFQQTTPHNFSFQLIVPELCLVANQGSVRKETE